MNLKCLEVIFPFITKVFPKIVYRGVAFDQLIPVIMSDLVTEVSKQRTVGLVQLLSLPLTFYIIGFRDIDRNDAVGMPCKYPWTFGTAVFGKKRER